MPSPQQQTTPESNSGRRIGTGKNDSHSPSKILSIIIIILVTIISIINILASHVLDDGISNIDASDGAKGKRPSQEVFQTLGGRKTKHQKNITERRQYKQDDIDKDAEKQEQILAGKTELKQQQQITKQQLYDKDAKKGKILGGLSCELYGGPSEEVASEMVYWSDIESDSLYTSPFHDEASPKYVTFEPDHGGWNNIRMGMETVLVMAHAMGRTLVLPPDAGMYLLGKGDKEHKNKFSFKDFFHLDRIAVEHKGIDIITMDEFLRRTASKGMFKNHLTGTAELPPDGKVDWNGQSLGPLWKYLENVSHQAENWDPHECVAAIPSAPGQEAVDELLHTMVEVTKQKLPDPEVDYKGEPTAVDAPVVERLRELMAERSKLCVYDTKMQEEPLIHFAVSKTTRLLSHFYAFIFFQDWKQDLWSKRFVRDHVRYIDEMMCAAARIVDAVRKRASANSPTQSTEFDTFHVRRGDFQYKKTRIDANALYTKSKDELTEGATLYIATDERDKTFFDPLQEHYNLTYLDDYAHLIEGINPNYYGMLDQLVAYRGRTFFGTWFSTLSGFVNRMRGYASVKQKWPGYEGGGLPSFYFVPDDRKFHMAQYMAVKLPIYMREFPVSWRDIDRGIGEIDQGEEG